MRPDQFDSVMADLSHLLRRRAGAKSRDFSTQIRRADRLLSRRARRAGMMLAQAQGQFDHPRLRHQLDARMLRREAKILRGELEALNPWDRFVGRVLGGVGTIIAGMIFLTAVVVFVLVWRGYV